MSPTDEVQAAIEAMAPDVLSRLNVDFEDSVLFMARVLGDRPAATAAQVVAVDRAGVDVRIQDPEGDHERRFAFGAEVEAPTALTGALLGLVVEARARSGEVGTTSAEREVQRLGAIRTMVTRVHAVHDVHPHLRRITFAGGDLETFAPLAPDTFVYVLLPPRGRTELTIDQSFTWEAYGTMPEEERPAGAYYTVRSWRPDVGELDALFVLHGDEGDASAWAAGAQPGDPVALWGPRSAFEPPAGTGWYLLVADETGLPAVAAILESLPAGTVVRVLAEVADEGARQDLPASPTVEVTWLHRDGAAPGTTSLLADAARVLTWPAGTPYVWGGGESHAMTAVRTHVRRERGLERAAVSLIAYWRHAAHAPDTGEDDLDEA